MTTPIPTKFINMSLIIIIIKMEIQKLIRFNEWWKTGSVPEDLLEEYKRPMYHDILTYLEDRQVLAIIGLRRVGKTTLMYQLIHHLLKRVKKEHIIYFSFDEEQYDVEDVLETYREFILKGNWREFDRIYVFFDEVQKVDNWQNKLKVYYDLYPNIKFVVSGSAGLVIEKEAKESLAGRLYDFNLGLLTFREFLFLKKFKIPKGEYRLFGDFKKIEKDYKNLVLFESDLRGLFTEYLFKGGFPEIVNERDDKKIKRYIKNSVIDKVIYSDIPKIFRIEEPDLLLTLLKFVADTPGLLLDYKGLAENLGRNRKTIANYFSYLQKSFLVLVLSNFSGSFLASARKIKKAYIQDTGITCTLMSREIDDRVVGMLVENLIVSKLKPGFFYRRNYEIDALLVKDKEVLPVEVKYRAQIDRKDVKNVWRFCKKLQLKRGVIITKDLLRCEEKDGIEVHFIPAWLFLLYLE